MINLEISKVGLQFNDERKIGLDKFCDYLTKLLIELATVSKSLVVVKI